MRAIDADALERILRNAITIMKSVTVALDVEDDKEFQMEIKAYTDILNGVKEQPTIEPERKKGKWTVKEGELLSLDECSVCRKIVIHRAPHYNFCPHCGADMRGDDHDL